MTLQNAPEARPASAAADATREESARYALLRRIAPTLRHHMAGTLQPIGMISAIMERRLQAAEPDLAVLRENGKSISTLSRSASSACMNLITWVAPKEKAAVSLQVGVEECVGMLATDMALRGFSIVNQVGQPDFTTPVFALRTVLTAALMALTDSARAPASVLISSEPADGQIRVLLTLTSDDDAGIPDNPRSYRKLGWDDVQALAEAEQISLSHSGKRADMLFSEAEQGDTYA